MAKCVKLTMKGLKIVIFQHIFQFVGLVCKYCSKLLLAGVADICCHEPFKL